MNGTVISDDKSTLILVLIALIQKASPGHNVVNITHSYLRYE